MNSVSISFTYTDEPLVLTVLDKFHVFAVDANGTRLTHAWIVLPDSMPTQSNPFNIDVPEETARIEVVPVNVDGWEGSPAYCDVTASFAPPAPPPVPKASHMMMMGQTRYLDYEVSPGSNYGNVFPQGLDLLRIHDSQCNFKFVAIADGEYEWSVLDKHLDSCEKRGVQVLYTFAYTPEWAIRPDFRPQWDEPGAMGKYSNYPPRLDVFEAFFRALLDHVRRPDGSFRIQYFEAWNETNSLGYWCGTDDILMEQQQMLWRVLQEVAPGCLLTTPTPTLNFTTVEQAIDSYLKQGFQNYSHIVSFHGYCDKGTSGNEITDTLIAVNDVMARNNCNHPLWDTEWNWTQGFADDGAVPREDVPKWIEQALLARMQNNVACAIWFQWDSPNKCGPMLEEPTWHGVVSGIGYAWIDFYNSIHPLQPVNNLVAV